MTDTFSDDKIMFIEKQIPDGKTVVLCWLKLLCLAGKYNNGGAFSVCGQPLSTEMLASAFGMNAEEIAHSIDVLCNFGMLGYVDDVLTILNWEKYQSEDALARIREQNKKRQAVQREKARQAREQEKLEASRDSSRYASRDSNVTRNAISNVIKSRFCSISSSISTSSSDNTTSCSNTTLLHGGGGLNNIDTNNESVTTENNDITTDTIEDTREEDKLVAYASNNLLAMTPNNIIELLTFRDELNDQLIIHAIDVACMNGKRTYAYVKAILNRYVEAEYTDVAQAIIADENFAKRGEAADVRASERFKKYDNAL